jgi:hypothetical protein
MSIDPFPGEQGRIIRQLQKDVERLNSLAGVQQPLPVTQASAAFLVPATATPATPGSGAILYVEGNELRWRSTAGDFAARTDIDGVDDADWTLFNAPPSYDQAHIQTIIDTLESLRISYQALLAALNS